MYGGMCAWHVCRVALLQGCKPSVKTDVFSFGVTLYELLTRKEPYEEHESLEDVLDKLADAALTPPLRPTLPEGLPADVSLEFSSTIPGVLGFGGS